MVKNANPAPLGLISFGMTTILLNEHNAGIFGLSVTILAMGIAIGGLAQIIAGIFELKQGNTFGGTAFTAYGFFWISLCIIWLNPGDKVEAANGQTMGFYLMLWGIFSLCMFICTLRHNRAIQVVFLSLTILFFGLMIGDFTENEIVGKVTGIIGIFCGASAFYTAIATLFKVEFGREVLPICEMSEKK